MDNFNDNTKTTQDILKRLKRIEGQVRGIHRMIEEEKPCIDVLTQISAIRSAINKVGGVVLENYSKKCFFNTLPSNDNDNDKKLKELTQIIQRFINFID